MGPRRLFLAVAAAAGLAAIVVAGIVVASDDDEPSTAPPGALPTSTDVRSTPGGPEPTEVTTPSDGGPVESGGSTPVPGALLTITASSPDELEVDGATCGDMGEVVRTRACRVAEGSGGTFVVAIGEHDDGSLQVRLYVESEGSFRALRESQRFEAGIDVADVFLVSARLGGEDLVVVDYDFDGSGSVHSFDVVAWEDGEDPGVVAHVGGTGMDRFNQRSDSIWFVSANYDDGAPTCCPTTAEVRRLERDGPGEWRIESEKVPFDEAP